MTKSAGKWLLPAVALAALFTASTPASAYSQFCAYSITNAGTSECSTHWVSANSSSHYIYYEVSPLSNYSVMDDQTDVELRRAKAGTLGKRETIFGLYGSRYLMTVWGTLAGWAYMTNT